LVGLLRIEGARFLKIAAACALFLTLARETATAATINVPADQPTIQDGINAAASGDVVLVAPGTYTEQIIFAGPPVKVASSGGPSVTTINGNGGPVVTFATTGVLTGFTITGGVNGTTAGAGGGILVKNSTSPMIFGNIITGNSACRGGGGIAVDTSSPTIESNTITNNSQIAICSGGSGGGGILVEGEGAAMILDNTISNNSWSSGDGGGISLNGAGETVIMNNLVTGNLATGSFDGGGNPSATGGGIATDNDSDPFVEQNVIVNNKADLGAGVAFSVPLGSAGPLITNNTIIGNSATRGFSSAIYGTGYDGPVELFNNLLLAPSGESPVFCDNSFEPFPPVFENNDATGSGALFDQCAVSPGEFGNFSADPMLVNPSGDFHLIAGSPAIDAGLNYEAGFSPTDFYGNARIVAGKNGDPAIVDVGAAEFQPPSPVTTPTPSATPTPVLNQINVPGDYQTIQGAINAASDGDTIMVAAGRYFEAINFNGKAITVSSTAGAAATIIDGHGLDSVVTFSSGETPSSVLSGFTITHGLALSNNGALDAGGGIAIRGASPTVTSNIIASNLACGGGAGILIGSGSPIIQSNVIRNNLQVGGCGGGGGAGISVGGFGSAQIIGNTITGNEWLSGSGGGIDLNFAGTPLLLNNTISNNLATGVFGLNPAAPGGGISVGSGTTPELIQNLVINNTADLGGGMYLSGASGAVLVNNTVAGNTSTQDLGSAVYINQASAGIQIYNNLLIGSGTQDALYCLSGTATMVTNDTFSGKIESINGTCEALEGTSGNISADPMFENAGANDYHLLDGSPAIDAGTNSAPDLPATDFFGNPRIVAGYIGDGAIVDLGIEEAPAGEPKPTPTATATATPTMTATPTATSTPAAARLSVSPKALRFAATMMGQTSKSESVELSNPRTSKQDTPILIENADITGPYFVNSAKSTCHVGESLSPKSKCEFSLSFMPTAATEQLGTFTIHDNSETADQSVVKLRGSGKASH
jgi:hypothetical protein